MNSILYLFYQVVGNARLAEMMFNYQNSNNYQEQHLLNWLRKKCDGRMDYFDIAIKLCGPPITRHRRFLLAKIYSWHSVGYSDKAIYYINLYLKNGLYTPMIKSNGIYTNKQMKKIHLWEMNRYLGKAYENLKDYENALKYYQVSLNYRPNIQFAYLDIANVYKKEKKLDKAISILEAAKKSKYSSKHKEKFILGDDYIDIDVIDRVLAEYKDLTLGIKHHEFTGFDSIEGINNKCTLSAYKNLKEKYKNDFEIHKKLLRKIDELTFKIDNKATNYDNLFDDYVKICLQDINVYKILEGFYFKINQLGLTNKYSYQDTYSNGYLLPKKACMLLEKNNRLDEAILICKYAIQNEIIEDGTKGKMYSRLEKLEKKKNKIENK